MVPFRYWLHTVFVAQLLVYLCRALSLVELVRI